MEYNEDNLTEKVLESLEGDINFVCSRYFVSGYDIDDLKQECRMRLWTQFHKYNFDREVLIRTWANQVMKNHLRNLLVANTRDKRRANTKILYIYNEIVNDNNDKE